MSFWQLSPKPKTKNPKSLKFKMKIFFKQITNPLFVKNNIHGIHTLVEKKISNTQYLFANLHDPLHTNYQDTSTSPGLKNLEMPILPKPDQLRPCDFEIYHPIEKLDELKQMIPTTSQEINYCCLHQSILNQHVITHIVKIKKGQIYQKYLPMVNQTVLVLPAEVVVYYRQNHHAYHVNELYAQSVILLDEIKKYEYQLNFHVKEFWKMQKSLKGSDINRIDHNIKRSYLELMKKYNIDKDKNVSNEYMELLLNPYFLNPKNLDPKWQVHCDPYFDGFMKRRLIEHPLLCFDVYDFFPLLRMMKPENIHLLHHQESVLLFQLKRMNEQMKRNDRYVMLEAIPF